MVLFLFHFILQKNHNLIANKYGQQRYINIEYKVDIIKFNAKFNAHAANIQTKNKQHILLSLLTKNNPAIEYINSRTHYAIGD